MKKTSKSEYTRVSFDEFSKQYVNPSEFKNEFNELVRTLNLFSIKYGEDAVLQLIKQIIIYY